RARALRLAAHVLGVPESEVEQAGVVFAHRRRPEHRVDLAQLGSLAAVATAAHGVEPGLDVTRHFQPPDITYSSGAQVALVDVDAESGQVTVLDHWICHDSGRLINPLIVEGQITGAVALGIGSVLYENVRYDADGQPLAGSFMDYALPRSADIPPL